MLKRAGKKLVVLLLLLAGTPFCLPATRADALHIRPDWRLLRRYYLDFSATLAYEKGFDYNKYSAFTQYYQANLMGYIYDPRLATFNLRGYYNDRSVSGTNLDNVLGSYDSGGVDLNINLFEYVDPNRGIPLWRYVPRPTILRFS